MFRRNLTNIETVVNDFIEDNGLAEPSTIQHVLPRYTALLTNAELQNLSATVDVMRNSPDQGVDIFVETLRFIYSRIHST